MASYWEKLKGAANNAVQGIGAIISKAPTTEQFLINGMLSPMEFEKAGDKLVETVGGWVWKSSLNPNKKSAYLPENKQFLMLDKVKCGKRATQLQQLAKQSVAQEGEDDVIIIEQIAEAYLNKQANNSCCI